MKKLILISIFFLSFSNKTVGDDLKIIINSPLTYSGPSTECRTEICIELLGLIDHANSSIDFAIYGLRGQPHILDALIDAEKRGVRVRGIIDKTVDGESYYKDTYLLEEKLSNIESDYQSDLETLNYFKNRKQSDSKECERPRFTDGPLQCFEGKGYASKEEIIFSGDIMHNKFFIVDNRFIWTGSANISDTGIGGYNANVVAVLDSPFFASFYQKEFDQMFIKGRHHRKKNELRKKKIEKSINLSNVSLYFSPQGYTMYQGVIPLIKNAEDSIDIAMFFLTHNNVSRELVNAKKRGVDVRIIVDATGATNGYSKHKFLRENGIAVKVENWGGKMHMKAAIIDREHLILGSMNWTSAGESKNDENSLIIRDSPAQARKISEFFETLWRSIPEKWAVEDPSPESDDSVNSCSDGIDNDFDEYIDSTDFGCVL